MCGLVGCFSAYLADKHKKAYKELLWASSVRGYDATGMIQVTAKYSNISKDRRVDPQTNTLKCVGPSPVLMNTKEFHQLVDDRETKALFGHCRARTVGENKFENAHPFEFDRIIGMHNGTLNGSYEGKAEFETDSEAIFKHINDVGVEAAIPELQGAWALTWFDKQNSTINFLRNNLRDLWLANEKHTDTIFWASEPGMLRWILGRNNIEIEHCVLLSTDTLISFDILDFRPERSMVVKKNIKRKEREISTTHIPFLPANDGGHAKGQDQATAKGVVAMSLREKTAFTKNGGTTDQIYLGFNRKQLTIPALKELLEQGCVFCGEEPKVGEAVRWINDSDFFCKLCKSQEIFNYKSQKQVPGHRLSLVI